MSEFATQANAKLDQIAQACIENGKFGPVVNTQIVNLEKPNWLAWVQHFDGSDPLSAAQAEADLRKATDYHLRKNSDNELGTPSEEIAKLTTGWSSRTVQGFTKFMQSTENALQYQQECTAIAIELVKLQGLHTAAMYEHVQYVFDQTLAAIGEAKKQAEMRKRKTFEDAIKTVGLIASGAATAGITVSAGFAAAAGALQGAGRLISSAAGSMGGDGGPWGATNKMCEALKKVSDDAANNREKFNLALRKSFEHYFGEYSTEIYVPALGNHEV